MIDFKQDTKLEVFNFCERLGMILLVVGLVMLTPFVYAVVNTQFAPNLITDDQFMAIICVFLGGVATATVGLLVKGFGWVYRFGWS